MKILKKTLVKIRGITVYAVYFEMGTRETYPCDICCFEPDAPPPAGSDQSRRCPHSDGECPTQTYFEALDPLHADLLKVKEITDG